nr:MAG TPA: hypothetical protein [Caudoviricetes sp.]
MPLTANTCRSRRRTNHPLAVFFVLHAARKGIFERVRICTSHNLISRDERKRPYGLTR